MRVIIAAVVITTLITMPAVAQYGPSSGYSKPPSAQKAKSKKTEATRSYAREYRGSPYSLNPAHDVYVNGEYVGSDPDPRVRATLAHEWRSQGGMR